MAPSKRNLVRRPTGPNKKAKLIDPWADVERAINESGLPEDTKQTLVQVLPLTLGEYADRRHRFQEQIVGAIGEVLKEVEANFVNTYKLAQTERDNFEKDAPKKADDAAKASKEAAEKQQADDKLKDVLATTAFDFRGTRSAFQEAEVAQEAAKAALKTSEHYKEEVQSMIKEMNSLNENLPESPEAIAEAEQRSTALIDMLKKYNFEQSMLVALPTALGKSKEARGRFGDIVIGGLNTELQKQLAEQEAVLGSAEAESAKHAAAVAKAQENFNAARDKQLHSAEAYEAASRELAEANAAAAAAQKLLSTSSKTLMRLTKAQDSAEADLEVFRQDAIATFEKLRQQEEPAPEPEEPVEQLAGESLGEALIVDEQAAVAVAA